jgi:hypothetical protein
MQIGEISLPELFLLFQSRRIHKAINPVLLQPQKISLKFCSQYQRHIQFTAAD